MKVLHLQKAAGIGGAEKHLTQLLPGLVDKGVEVYYLVLESKTVCAANTPLIDQLSQAGVHCIRIPMQFDLDWLGLRKAFRVIRKIQPDIIHTHLIQGDFYGAIYKYLYNKAKLFSSRHGYDESFQAKYGLNPEQVTNNKNVYYWLSWFSVQQADALIGISEGISRLLRAIPGGEKKVNTIPYGYESGITPKAIQQAEYILYIGRLIPFKRPDLLIDAYIRYRKQGGVLPLKIAGSGESEAIMKQKLAAEGLMESVDFLGRIQNPEALLPKAACLAVSSLSEGFGLVSLEAMNASIPVLAFDVPALNEVVQHKQTGLLCTPSDVQSFAAGLKFFSENESIRKEYGEAGKGFLISHFSKENMIDSTLQLYKKWVGVQHTEKI